MAGKFKIRALGAAALAFVLAGAAEAALTEQQVNEALGSVPGVTWSIEGPDADGWTVTGSGATQALRFSTLVPGVTSVKAVVTGPGVLELKSKEIMNFSILSMFLAWTEVDGVERPAGNTFWEARRITVPAGTHTVTWNVQRRSDAPLSAVAEFSGAKWEPFTVQPLAVGAKDESVTLSGAWMGQDRWHHGDGGGAFTGAGSGVSGAALRADFAGPGILSYRVLQGKGTSDLKLDGNFQMRIQAGSGWQRWWFPVGSGNHTAAWQADGDYSEVVVDEIAVVQEVPLAAALDVPGRVWISTSTGNARAIGLPTDDAVGGSAVLLNRSGSFSTVLTGGGFFKIRYRGTPYFLLDGSFISHGQEAGAGIGWSTAWVGIPAQGGTMQIQGLGEFDHAEWEPMPGTVAAALGLPEQSTTTGGEGTWMMVPDTATGKFSVRTALTTAVPTAWAETVLTGPAKVDLDYEANTYGSLEFLLDGKRLWDSLVPVIGLNGRKQVTLEIPAGQHVLRCAARAFVTNYQFTATIHGIVVTGNERDGEISEGLGFGQAWTRIGDWEQVTALTHGGGTALRPVVPAGHPVHTAWLGTTVTGPGYLSFWTHLPESSSAQATLTIHGDMLPHAYPQMFSDGGWSEHRQWIPEGTHHLQMMLYGTEEQMAQIAVDEMNFTPSETTGLEQISSGEPLVWQNDPVKPWTTFVKAPGEPAVAVSPEVVSGGTGNSRISTRVTGPGLLKFKWRKEGRRTVSGRFLIDTTLWTNLDNLPEQDFSIEIPAGVHDLVWEQGSGSSGSWLEVEDVNWQPWPESSLASALDTPEGVTWTSGGDEVFTGRPDAGSKGGTAAYVRLGSGQTSWLETTVEGPGVFDFWLRESATSSGSWRQAMSWVVTVDGEEVLWSGQYNWNPIWIREAGSHKVRITFTNNTYSLISGLVDDVTCFPLVEKTLDSSWTAEVSDPWNGYGGADGGGLLLRMSYFTPAWFEKTVTGPCEVSWNSQVIAAGDFASGVPKVTVDGKAGTVIQANAGWQSYVLSIPAGTHTIRWENVAGISDGSVTPEEDQESLWQISQPVVTPGVSAMAQAMDAPESCWLVWGSGAEPVTGAGAMDGVDAVELGPEGIALYLNLSGSSQRLACGVRYAGDANWSVQRKVVAADEAVPWGGIYGFADPVSFALDGFTTEDLTDVALNEAVDRVGEITSGGWRGIVSATESADGVDCGWAFVGAQEESQVAVVQVPGSARVRFRWKREGNSSLVLRLNGSVLPVAVAGPAWAEVSIDVGGAGNRIEWEHTGVLGTTNSSPGEAWLDALVIEPLAPWDLTAAIGPATGMTFTASLPEYALAQWKPAAFQLPGGQTVTGVRAATGYSMMQAMITGPTVVHFRAACFADKAAAMAGRNARGGKSVWESISIGGGGGGPGVITGYELTVQMNGDLVAGVPYREGVEWNDVAIPVPSGTHKILWQLSTVRSGSNGESRETAKVRDLQAVVTGLRLESMRARFDQWAESLPDASRGPDDDADGDGVSNLLEYAFRSSSADASSKPAQVNGKNGPPILYEGALSFPWGYWVIGGEAPVWVPYTPPTIPSAASYELMIPYLSRFVDATVEMSDDMESWEVYPVKWLDGKPTGSVNFGGVTGHTNTHQSVIVPLYQADSAKFFRVRVAVPE